LDPFFFIMTLPSSMWWFVVGFRSLKNKNSLPSG